LVDSKFFLIILYKSFLIISINSGKYLIISLVDEMIPEINSSPQ
jgi:hypothetical protein